MTNGMGYGGFGGPLLAIIGIWSIVGLGVYVWYLWSLARLFPLLGLPAAHGWIPIWNQWRLIERGGLPGWTAVVGIIPGLNIITVVMSIIAIHRINREHEEGAGMTVLGALLPPLWATLLGSRLQDRGHAAGLGQGVPWGSQGHGLVEYGPDGQVYPLLPGGAPGPSQQQFSMPQVPQSFGGPPQQPATPTGPTPTPAPHPAATPLSPGGHQPAAPSAAQPVPANPPVLPPGAPGAPQSNPWGLGNTTEGNFQRLASEQQPSREASFGSSFDARPFSWPQPAPIPPEAPLLPTPQPVAQQPASVDVASASGDDAWRPSAQAAAAAAAADAAAGAADPAPAMPEVLAETRVTAAEVAPVLPPLTPPVHPSVQPPAPHVPSVPSPEAAAPLQEAVLAPEPALAPVPVPTPEPAPAPAPAQFSEPVPTPEPAPFPEPVLTPEPVPTPEPAPVVAPGPVAGAESLASRSLDPEPLPEPLPELLDDDLDQTIAVSRRARWVLELPDGQQLELAGDDIVVGRKPTAQGASDVLVIPDSTRTLSKSHARLRLEGDSWTIEDLNSTNGVFTIDAVGEHHELTPGARATATEQLVIGTLEVRLRVVD